MIFRIINFKVNNSNKRQINVKSTKQKQVSFDLKPVSIIPNEESDVNENSIGIKPLYVILKMTMQFIDILHKSKIMNIF